MELVSVIIPVYNGEKTIRRCVDSVLHQTWNNFEIIIVNDGSTDETAEILQNEYSIDKRIKIIHQSQSGSPVAKNVGMKNATGDFFQFLDCDDYISADKFENQIRIIGRFKSTLVWCSSHKNSISNKAVYKVIDKKKLYSIDNPFEFLLSLNGIDGHISMIQPNAFLVSKEIIRKAGIWNEELSKSPDDDSEFFSRIILNSDKIAFDDLSCNYYSCQENSLSNQINSVYAEGALKTVKYKFENILTVKNTVAIRKLYRKHLSIVAYLYGHLNGEVLNEAFKLIQSLGFRRFSFVGGCVFRIISTSTSFKTALIFQNYFKRCRKYFAKSIIE